MGLFGRKKGGSSEVASILKKRYKSRHAFDRFKMKEAFKALEALAESIEKQGLETRVLEDYVVDVDVDFESGVVTVTYDEGREFFRKDEKGNYTRIQPGGG